MRNIDYKLIGVAVSIILAVLMQTSLAPSWAAYQPSQSLNTSSITVHSILVSGLKSPLGIYSAKDGTGRLFVLEQEGLVKIIKNGQVLANPFLDIRGLLPCGPGTSNPSCGERGLLGLAFHPNFKVNGEFFINYTRKPDGATVIARYSISNNPDEADANSRIEVLVIGQPFPNHNGGHLAFGLDGYLYIGMGDGGSGGDPLNNAQNMTSLLGKMLRIDIDNHEQNSQYSIPPGNLQDEIWALGLRNPWAWSFDRLTGDLYIGDVGQSAWEEVDFREFTDLPGANFGWSCLEGTRSYNLTRFPCNDGDFVAETVLPVAEYSHFDGQSITGGYVYRGNLYPDLYGRYFYADFVTGKIWSIQLENSQPEAFSDPILHLDENFAISCFGEDENGELFVCDYSGGTVRRLQDSQGGVPDLTGSYLHSDPIYADNLELVDFNLRMINSGGVSNNLVNTTISLPAGLLFVPSSLTASAGTASSPSPTTLVWEGILTDQPVDIFYQVTLNTARKNEITLAQISGQGYTSMTIKHALLIPRPVVATTPKDFELPGSQPGSLIDPIMLPASCDICHTEMIFDAWQGSMMSQSGRDPLFWAALEVANHDVPYSGEFCLRCHTPKGWLEGRSSSPDGSSLEPVDFDAGVACEICHRAIDPVPANNPQDQAIVRDDGIRSSILGISTDHTGNANYIIDPQDFRRGPFNLGISFPYHPNQTYRTDYLGGDPNNIMARSRLCGTCHNVDNPFLTWDPIEQEYLPNPNDTPAQSTGPDELFAVETTYEEWLNSDYAFTTACQDCHMPRISGYGAESFFNPPLRDCGINGCLPVHEFTGGNTWVPLLLQDTRWRLHREELADLLNQTIRNTRQTLRRAALIEVSELSSAGDNQQVTITVINLTGHKLPTGYAEGRRMWLEIRAYDENNNLVYTTCNYDSFSATLTEDQDCVVFEIKQAISGKLIDLLGLDMAEGESFHFLLNNSVFKDNRIPPAGFSAGALSRRSLQPMLDGLPAPDLYQPGENFIEQTFVLPGQSTQVVAILYYQTTSKDYIEFLRDQGGVDAQDLYELWVDSKSPPELVGWSSYPVYSSYLPRVSR